MIAPLFVTGASGFVGRRVLRLLAQSGQTDVRLLSRTPVGLTSGGTLPHGARVVHGDLASVSSWLPALEGVDTVLHLASSTGKVRRSDHFDAIVGGTERLLDAARGAGVSRFLFVSSIAAGFEHRRYYHYAEAKRAAEALVRASSFDWLIVRPTMVLGPESPVLSGLRTLATLPLPVIFGSGNAPVEPIAVDDLAAILVAALDVNPWGGRTISIGGPERVTVEELIARIRSSAVTARFTHIPLAPVRELLGALEPLFFPLLPMLAGQLATFANPSVGASDDFTAGLPVPTTRIAAMLGEGTRGG